MEAKPNSNKGLDDSKKRSSRSAGESNAKSAKEQAVTGTHYHNYVPKHSSHGRANIRGIGFDHEPGTMR